MELYKQAATQFKLGKKCTLKLNISRVWGRNGLREMRDVRQIA
jgi:hypothetical protein